VPAPLTYVHRTPTRPRTTRPRSEPSRGQGGLATRVSSRKDLSPRVGERGERASIRQVPPLPLPHAWVRHPQDQARPGLRTEVVPIRTPAKGTHARVSADGLAQPRGSLLWASQSDREGEFTTSVRWTVHGAPLDPCMHMHGAVSVLNGIPSCTASVQVGMLTWAACGALMSTMWVPNALPKRRGASSCASDAVATAMMRVVAMLGAADTQHALVRHWPTELGHPGPCRVATPL